MQPSFLLASMLVILAASTCVAQTLAPQSGSDKPPASSQPAPPAPSQAAPAVPKADAPKDSAAEKDQPKDKKKPKKVWSNDDVSTIKSDVPVVGDSRSSGNSSQNGGNSSPLFSSSPSSDETKINSFRSRLAQLRSELADVEAQIRQARTSNGHVREEVDQFVRPLEAKRAKLQSQIDAIEEEARQQGIQPGQLR